ncbi:hypothetical protein HK101_000778 [Irineochytrium annulatum]|nr:hypothetical protein HK101_000778 [Irineochytrium annulatum]
MSQVADGLSRTDASVPGTARLTATTNDLSPLPTPVNGSVRLDPAMATAAPPSPAFTPGTTATGPPTSERRSVPNPAAEKYMVYVRIAIFFILLVGTCYGVVLVQGFSLLLLLHSHTAYRAYIRVTAQAFGSVIMIVTYLLCPGTKLVVTGDFDRIRARGKSIVIANHQIYPDWFYLWAFTWLRGCHGDLKIMLVEWLKYLPIFGQGMWFFEFIFMKQKWDLDKDNMKDKLLKAKDPASPLMLLIFPEGTLNTPENIKKSQAYAKKMNFSKHPRHMLLPKSTGLQFCATTLMPEVDDLFDLTVGYSGLKAGQIPYDEYLVPKVFFHGEYPKEVHIHVKAHSLRSIPGLVVPTTSADGKDVAVQSDAERAEAFNKWLRDVFYDKDDRMERFYQTGSLLDDKERMETPRLLARAAPELQDWVVVVASWYAMWKLTPLYAWAVYWVVLYPLYLLLWGLGAAIAGVFVR